MPGKVLRFERSTLIPRADADRVWSQATAWRGVNAELMPLVRMTHPAGRERIDARAEREPFVSWILLFGLVPIERHRVQLDLFDAAGRRFHEHSSNWATRDWIHRRSVTAEGLGARVTDRCAFAARLPCLAPLIALAYRFVFQHRHRRLRAMYGAVAR